VTDSFFCVPPFFDFEYGLDLLIIIIIIIIIFAEI